MAEINPIAFFLGAGASKDAGIPTSDEMTKVLADRLSASHQWKQHSKALNYVIAAIIHNKSSCGETPFRQVNVEDVFTALKFLSNRDSSEAAAFVGQWSGQIIDFEGRHAENHVRAGSFIEKLIKHITTNRSSSSDAASELEKIFTAIVRPKHGLLFQETADRLVYLLLREVSIKDVARVEYLRPLVSFFQKAQGGSIFSLNYDNAIELCCKSVEQPISYCLPELTNSNDNTKSLLNLIKLHGSYNWVIQRDKRFRQTYGSASVKISDETFYPDTEGWRSVERGLLFGRGQKLRVQGPFLELLRLFENTLMNEIIRLVVVGYSFSDEHINYYLDKWMAEKKDARLVIVFPENERSSPQITFHNYLLSRYTPRVRWEKTTACDALAQMDMLLN